jgi:tRNA-2-methylthio-N6-dimethylallyladenosine synthase
MASPDLIGKVLPVSVESLERYSLIGTLVELSHPPSLQAVPSAMTTGA